MIFILFTSSLCAKLVGLCLTTRPLECHIGYKAVSAADLPNKINDGNIYKIIADGTQTLTLNEDKFLYLKEIEGFGRANIIINIIFSQSVTHSGLKLTNASLRVISKANLDKKKDFSPMMTFSSLDLKNMAIITGTGINIVNLKTESIQSASKHLEYLGIQSNIIIDGNDVVSNLELSNLGVKISDSNFNYLYIQDDSPIVTIRSHVTVNDTFKITGNYKIRNSPKFTINFIESNPYAILTLENDENTNYKGSNIHIDVSTRYRIGKKFPYDQKKIYLSAGEEVKSGPIPNAKKYCYKDEFTTVKPTGCPSDAELLKSEDEIISVINDVSRQTVSIIFFGSTLKNSIPKDKIKTRSIKFIGGEADPQNINISLEKNDRISIASPVTFQNMNVNIDQPYISFIYLIIKNSDILCDEIYSNRISTDPISYFNIKDQMPSKPKEFSITDISKAQFNLNDESVTFFANDGKSKLIVTAKDIPIPFTIAHNDPDKSNIDIVLSSDTTSVNKALEFSIEVNKGELDSNYIGDWSSYTINVNVEASSKFVGAKGLGTNDRSPTMFNIGKGIATLDNIEIPSPPVPTPTVKPLLTTGQIVGIVITLVVIIVVIVLIIKYKSYLTCDRVN